MICFIKKYLIICIAVTSVVSCKKTNTYTVILPADIIGKWKWQSTYAYNPGGPPILLTPQSTGINEMITYYADKTWSKKQNNLLVDSGNYSIGHASRRFDPWSIAQIDSIQYYKNGLPIAGKVDYYYRIVDSLNINPGLGGLGPGDSKWLIRQ